MQPQGNEAIRGVLEPQHDALWWLVINETLGGTGLFLCPHVQGGGRLASGQGGEDCAWNPTFYPLVQALPSEQVQMPQEKREEANIDRALTGYPAFYARVSRNLSKVLLIPFYRGETEAQRRRNLAKDSSRDGPRVRSSETGAPTSGPLHVLFPLPGAPSPSFILRTQPKNCFY